MSRNPAVGAITSALVGSWTGTGTVEYPTIDTSQYREATNVIAREDHPALIIEQRTWKLTPEGETPSHWETGLLRIKSDGSAVFTNAQGGRAESMTGTWRADSDGWTISLASTGYAGDDRVLASTREYRLSPGRLTYEMSMETSATNRLDLHLEATLSKDV